MVILILLNSDLLLLVLLFMVMATAVVSLLWFLRERRLLRSLQALIAEEKMENLESKHSNPKDMKEALRALFETRKEELLQLQRLENYRRDYIGNVAHELKTPVFNVQGYIETLLETELDDAQLNRKFLEKANASCDRLTDLLKDLDQIASIESGNMQLELSRFDVVELTKETIEMLETQAQERSVTLRLGQAAERPIWVEADRKRIQQVFINLLMNSVVYGKEGGETRVRFYDMDDNLLIEIADDGLGIAKEHLPRLFERFYRVDKSRSRNEGGSGLGLAICKHIVDSHSQSISVRSTEGVGSTFAFTLRKTTS